jgi:uncharacterized damage-inducible protein DinB
MAATPPSSSLVTAVDLILTQLDEAYDRRSWHGANLRGSIRGVTAATAVWRPARGRHNIHELVVHAAYWKYAVRRRFTGEPRASFPLDGSNWFVRERADERTWRNDLQLLGESHRQLRAVVSELDDRQLARTPRGSLVSNRAILTGIIAHDLYHAGQIQLLKRLAGKR